MPLIERIAKFSSAHRFLSHIIFWLVTSIVFLNRYDIDEYHDFHKILIRHAYYISFTIVSSYFLTYLIIPKLITAKTYYLVTFYFLIGSYIICVCSRIVVVHVLEPFLRTAPFGQETVLEIAMDVPKLITHYFPLTFSAAWIFAFIKLIKEQYAAQQHKFSLEKERAETELKALKAQLNPHFLFNTLNNIYSLSLMNSPVTSKSIARLSEILDHVLYRCNGRYVSLSAEITLIKNYIELEKLRYGERLVVNFRHTIDHDTVIAPLILLSLVENAFKHGAGEDIGQPVINIDLKLVNNHFRFTVLNSFMPGREKEENRIGINNITRQLRLLYPEEHDLSTTTYDNIFVVLLHINLNNSTYLKDKRYESKVSFS
ncbi:sensor histidine kinase [Pedobacter zeae]|uniref:Sensor histidine kinase YesM n=1 Tax=Pedobacter zeae TaxID=1737356 RepID=A0A7W6K9U3_9SPHI|nr:sensor histidine kinase [Pedobacter zeae]MBB4107850.1 sensor histidine kinase YesM [Pedobacter zeae]